MNPYHVLGVAPDSSLETLKATYRRLARENHPDSLHGEEARAQATQRMSAINAAWQVLSDPASRASLDARLRLEAQEREFRARVIHPPRSVAPVAAKGAATPRKAPFVPPATRVARATGSSRGAKAQRHSATGARVETRRTATGHTNKNTKKAVRPAKLSPREKLIEAAHLHQQGRGEAAVAFCLSVLRADFRNVPARELLSDIYAAQGQLHRAFALLEQALQLQPTNAVLVRKLNQLSNRSGTLHSASTQQRPAVPTPKPPAAPELSPLATSVKYSVLGRLIALLFGRGVSGK